MAKLKLLIVGDAGAPTGFATVTHNLTRYLQSTGEFEVKIIAINYDGRTDNQWAKEFSLIPARNGGDFLGIGMVPSVTQEFKPDSFLMFQDFWNIPLYISQLPPFYPGTVAYYPVDAPNIKGQYMMALAACYNTICYTDFGREESVRAAKEAWDGVVKHATENNVHIGDKMTLQVGGMADPITGRMRPLTPVTIGVKRLKDMRDTSGHLVIPHGIDTSMYKPVSKKGSRKLVGLPLNGFYVGNVNRNQSRKRLDLTIRAFSGFAKDHPDARLILHCVKTDGGGWDLEQLATYYGVHDKVIFTHTLFPAMEATTEQLNLLYNSLDVQINTGGGEGWGLTTFEGAAVGVPQVVPDWSATKEIWGNAGLLTKVASVRHEPGQINTMQSVIDTDHLISQLSELYENPAMREEVGKKCFEVTQREEYKWENVGKKFADVFKDAAGKVVPSPQTAITAKGQVDLVKHIRAGHPMIRGG